MFEFDHTPGLLPKRAQVRLGPVRPKSPEGLDEAVLIAAYAAQGITDKTDGAEQADGAASK